MRPALLKKATLLSALPTGRGSWEWGSGLWPLLFEDGTRVLKDNSNLVPTLPSLYNPSWPRPTFFALWIVPKSSQPPAAIAVTFRTGFLRLPIFES